MLADATARARAGTLPQRPQRVGCEPIRSGPPRPLHADQEEFVVVAPSRACTG